MERIISRNSSLSRYWRRRTYQRLHSTTSRNAMKVIRMGGSPPQRYWKIQVARRLRLKIVSPLRLWIKFKNAYINMMLGLGGQPSTGNILGEKRIPKARRSPTKYSSDQFHDRLVYEIYKNLSASRELATI